MNPEIFKIFDPFKQDIAQGHLSYCILGSRTDSYTHTDLLQLHSSNNSLLTRSQQSNIFCGPSTEADRIIRTSAYMIAPMNISCTLQALLQACNSTKNRLIKILNKAGDMTLPHIIPLFTWKL